MRTLDIVTVAPVLLSSIIYAAVHGTFLLSIRRRRSTTSRPGEPTNAAPLVSVLKPLAGLDDDLADNLDSFAAIDYPNYEILFGLASPMDPALSFARTFLKVRPEVRARLVWTDPNAALNPKVAQLIGLTRQASGSATD